MSTIDEAGDVEFIEEHDAERQAVQERLAARREGFGQMLGLLDSGDEFVKVLGELVASDQRTRTESIRPRSNWECVPRTAAC